MWRLLLMVLLFSVGCSGDRAVPVTPPPAAEQLKVGLGEVSKAGQLGSAADGLATLISQLKESEPEKAAELEADLEKLRAARGPAAIRAKAKAMAEKL